MIHTGNFINMGSRWVGEVSPITIGDGTQRETLGLAPFSFAWDYSIAHMIYKQSEVGGAKTISKIAFYLGAQSDASYTINTQRIYLAHISLDDWSTNTPQVGLGDVPQVSDKTYVKTSFTTTTSNTTDIGTWIEFTLTSNFSYNGTDNLLISWENRDGSYDFGGPQYDNHASSNATAYRRVDGSYPSDTDNCTLYQYKPNIKIYFS